MATEGCIFCQIAEGEIPAEIVHEEDDLVAFRDIDPQAPSHVLVIPREHIETVNDLKKEHAEAMGRLFLAARRIARKEGVAEEGYRLVTNVGEGGGQSVFHIHIHLLGGRSMGWPPG